MIAGVHINHIRKYYLIKKDGTIKNLRTNRILKGYDDGKKIRHDLKCGNYIVRTETKHLVAHAFLDNPNNLSEVIYVDGNYKNNHVDNLLWRRTRRRKIIDAETKQKAIDLFMTGKYTYDEIVEMININKYSLGKILTEQLQNNA